MSKRINIILPEKTVSVLDRVTSKGNRSRFIDRAVLHYIETHGREKLSGQLKAGYSANADRWRNTTEVASVGVVAEAIDNSAREFYLHHEFLALPDQARKLFIAMGRIKRMFG